VPQARVANVLQGLDVTPPRYQERNSQTTTGVSALGGKRLVI
jgi:hypothetical protein